MVMPVQTFSVITGSPLLSGIQEGQNIATNLMRAAYLPEQLRQASQANQLAIQQAQQAAVTRPAMLQAQLEQAQAGIPLTQAQTAGIQERTRLAPQQMALAQLNAKLRQMAIEQQQNRLSFYSSPARLAIQAARTSPGQAAMAAIPEAQSSFNRMLAAQTAQAAQAYNQPMGQHAPMAGISPSTGAVSPALMQTYANTTDMPTVSEVHNLPGDPNISTLGTVSAVQTASDLPAVPAGTPADIIPISQTQQAAAHAYMQSMMDKKGLGQGAQKSILAGGRYETSAKQVLNWWDQGAKEYFGPNGASRYLRDEALARVGHVTPELMAYRNMANAINNANLQGAILENVPADQIARGDYNKILDISPFRDNQQSAELQLQNAFNMAKSAEGINQQLMSVQLNPAKMKALTEKLGNIVTAGRLQGQKLASSGVQIPSFENADQFNAWYHSQPSAIQDAVKKQLGGS